MQGEGDDDVMESGEANDEVVVIELAGEFG